MDRFFDPAVKSDPRRHPEGAQRPKDLTIVMRKGYYHAVTKKGSINKRRYLMNPQMILTWLSLF